MDARKASCAAPISMGRGEIPVELCQQHEKTTYRFGNRSFVVEPVFRQDGPDTLGSILLRLMKSESEAK